MTGLLALLGQGQKYAPGEKKFNQYADFDTNNLTTSFHRFANNNILEVEYPATVVRGPSVRWVQQSLKYCKTAMKNAYLVETPVLLLQAGSDTIVKNKAQDKFCSQVPNCRKVTYAAAKHEILQEQDVIRDQAIGEMKKFILRQ
jgi:lysophospholipase